VWCTLVSKPLIITVLFIFELYRFNDQHSTEKKKKTLLLIFLFVSFLMTFLKHNELLFNIFFFYSLVHS